MQEVRYKDPSGRTIRISPKVSDYVFHSIEGTGGLQATSQTTEPFSMHGAIFYGARVEPREVTLNFYVRGDNRRQLYQRRELAARVLSPMPSEHGALGRLEYKNDTGTWWIPAYVYQGPMKMSDRLENYELHTTIFFCPDPFWRGPEMRVERLGFLGGAFRFPLIIPAKTEARPGIKFGKRAYLLELYNDGNSPTPLEITIQGPATRPELIHKETGQRLAVDYALTQSEKMVIDTTKGSKRVVAVLETGEEIPVMDRLSPDSTFLQLRKGTNTIEYKTGDDTILGHVDVAFWPRYGGV